jgi:hypothetical protein
MYVAASQNTPRDLRLPIAAALALLDREERPAIVGPMVGDDPGWRLQEQAAADNLGVAYSVLSAQWTAAVATATRLSLGAEWRELAEHTASHRVDIAGYGATVGGWQEVTYGPLLARFVADGGLVSHPLAGTFGEAHGTLSAWLFAWQVAVQLGTEPAYPSLFSIEALLPANGGHALTEHDVDASIGGPLGVADIGAHAEQSLLSDGNRRVAIDLMGRYPILPNVYAVYSLNRVSFRERSTLYWDPAHYTAQGLGLEYAVRHARGLSFSARVLPTYAVTAEASLPNAAVPGNPGTFRGPIEISNAIQFGADTELGYRASRWEFAGTASYGRGRAADYQRGALSVVVRLVP